jgi:pantoate--beta-alanine ligase
VKIVRTIAELDKAFAPFRGKSKTIGFVPTMGALHEGHISLIDMAKIENHVAVCSIFVNPIQFNDPKDLERYPRPLKEDEQLLKKANCDVLFIPSVQEMYPKGDYSVLQEDFGNLDKVMEGKARPGHFAGMITIVSKLFNAVRPNNAYFGSKDFQQMTLVKYFVKKHNLPINVIGCPIIREEDGLAMSSRNRLLSAEERKYAALIPQTMAKVKEMWGSKTVEEIRQFVANTFTADGHLRLDYFEISYADNLLPVTEPVQKNSPIVACIAAFDGNIRLIDNLTLNPDSN